MASSHGLGIGVRRVEGTAFGVWSTGGGVESVEGEEQQPGARLQAVDEVLHALDVAVVDPPRCIMNTAGVQIEQTLRILHRMEKALHVGIHLNAAARITRAHQMHVTIQELRGVDPSPGRTDQVIDRRI
jgi:hypothetical protein